MYLYAREDSGQIPTTLQSRNPTSGFGGMAGLASDSGEYLGQLGSDAPVFRIECPDGCPPVMAGQCRAVLRRAIRDAIKLASNAAIKLDEAIKVEPSKRDAEAKNTARLFQFFFGHDPSHLIPWDAPHKSGASVAKRFRAVVKALQKGGRNTLFRCLVTRPGCADDDLTCCAPNANAWVSRADPNVLNLCAQFWDPPAGLRGLPPPSYRSGVIIHEMLHMLFHEFLQHDTRRANAHCYEAFALRLAGFGAAPIDVCLCRGTTPCPP
jgi:hypothetical protein